MDEVVYRIDTAHSLCKMVSFECKWWVVVVVHAWTDVNIGGTVTVASANINAATSNSATGTLTTALTGVATTTITITANNNQLFDASRNLVIGSVTVRLLPIHLKKKILKDRIVFIY